MGKEEHAPAGRSARRTFLKKKKKTLASESRTHKNQKNFPFGQDPPTSDVRDWSQNTWGIGARIHGGLEPAYVGDWSQHMWGIGASILRGQNTWRSGASIRGGLKPVYVGD